ncbi:MAG: hypothetical protein JNM43_23245 [Planctomycetaceae bacterium]|nr:hypothetical protein [Planctomycetaceae bacterium]
MLPTSWKKCVAALFLAALCPAAIASDDLANLKARLDAIEMENKQLRDDLDALKAADEAMIGQMTELNGQVVGKADKKPDDPLSFSAKWNNGFEASTKDKNFKFHVGGRVQFDTVFLEASRGAFAGTGPFTDQDAVTFRRARLRADGTMYETIDWCAEFDFVNSVNDNPGTTPTETNVITVPVPTDLWITFREVPIVNNLRIGNVKEPIGFEHLTSSRYLEFMERSYNQDIFTGAFNNGFTPGVVVWDNWAEEHGTWSTGVFKNNSNGFGYGIGDGEYAWTSRVTYLPWFEDEGRYLTHLGVSGSVRDPNNHQAQYRARGSLRNGMGGVNPTLSNTGLFNTTEVEMAGLEFVHQMDSLMFQAEYMGAWNHKSIGNGTSAPLGAQLGDVYVYGWYAETLYFLTGEHREYEKKSGVFGRVIPKNNYGKCGYLGAFQVGARYNQLCLVDSGMDGGRLDDVTLGLNWFLNPNLKIQSNYTYTIRDAQASPGGGDYYGYGMRVAWDF